MTQKPPAPNPLTSGWDLEDEGAGATREVEADELFLRAGLVPGSRPTPPVGVKVVKAPPLNESATVRPPMPTDEYVDQMMKMAPPSETGLSGFIGAELGDAGAS